MKEENLNRTKYLQSYGMQTNDYFDGKGMLVH